VFHCSVSAGLPKICRLVEHGKSKTPAPLYGQYFAEIVSAYPTYTDIYDGVSKRFRTELMTT